MVIQNNGRKKRVGDHGGGGLCREKNKTIFFTEKTEGTNNDLSLHFVCFRCNYYIYIYIPI